MFRVVSVRPKPKLNPATNPWNPTRGHCNFRLKQMSLLVIRKVSFDTHQILLEILQPFQHILQWFIMQFFIMSLTFMFSVSVDPCDGFFFFAKNEMTSQGPNLPYLWSPSTSYVGCVSPSAPCDVPRLSKDVATALGKPKSSPTSFTMLVQPVCA